MPKENPLSKHMYSIEIIPITRHKCFWIVPLKLWTGVTTETRSEMGPDVGTLSDTFFSRRNVLRIDDVEGLLAPTGSVGVTLFCCKFPKRKQNRD